MISDHKSWLNQRAYFEGFISPGSTFSDLRSGTFDWRADVTFDRPVINHSPAVARRWNDAVQMYTTSNWEGAGEPKRPLYVPYASGTPIGATAIFDDSDDAAAIEETLCSSLHSLEVGDPTCRCDNGLSAGCGDPPTSLEELPGPFVSDEDIFAPVVQ